MNEEYRSPIDLNIDPKRVAELEKKYAALWDPSAPHERMVTIAYSTLEGMNWQDVWSDPQTSLDFSLKRLAKTMALGDDTLPMVRVEMGTVLLASAFGCEVRVEPTAWPAVLTHPITSPEALANVRHPDPLTAGELPRALRFMKYFRENLPTDVRLSQCDTQGPWNIAHLIAGDQIFYDVMDDPDSVGDLLDAVADLTLDFVPRMREVIQEPEDAFYLQGMYCPGGVRICNCSTDMISPDFYAEQILERDARVLDAMGGGLMHICGSSLGAIPYFNKLDSLRSLEIALNHTDTFAAADLLREDIVLRVTGPVDPPLLTPLGESMLARFARGEFPDKKNIVFHFNDPVDEDRAKWLLDICKG